MTLAPIMYPDKWRLDSRQRPVQFADKAPASLVQHSAKSSDELDSGDRHNEIMLISREVVRKAAVKKDLCDSTMEHLARLLEALCWPCEGRVTL